MDRPNVLLITTDQQRFDTICALGNKSIYTPHLNWLVDQGVTFTRCYSDSPICMAARATIMTGKHGYTTGLVGNSEAVKPMAENPTLPGLLTGHGYQTRAVGKMHFSPIRVNYGFEHMELPMDYYRAMNKRADGIRPKAHGVGENEMEPVISTVDEVNSLTYWTVDRSIDFLETRDESRPFFMWTSFTKPHPPFDPCANYWSLYQNKDVPSPVYGDWSKDIEDVPAGYLSPTYCLNNSQRFGEEQLKDSKRAYYACITQIDYSLGLLFARMREMNLLENTWIIFTTDHGEMLGDHHMGAKSTFFEGSAHIPLIVRPPHGSWDIHPLAGRLDDSLVSLADILPTVLGLADVDSVECDGRDLLSPANEKEERIFFGNSGNQYFVVIQGEYKYLWTSLGGGELLFNVVKDPLEKHNLMASKEHEVVLTRLRSKLIEHLKSYAPSFVSSGELVHNPAPAGPSSVAKWPGFHSTVVPTDVLH